MRTQGAYFGDTAHNGGVVLVDAIDLTQFSANLVLTRNAQGDYSLNRTAAGAETYNIVANVGHLVRKLTAYPGVNGMPYQQQFGTAAGAAGYPAGAAGLPPFAGAAELTAPTAPTPKGIQITDVFAIYQVGVASLTSAALSLNRTTFADGQANVITNLPVSATALVLTAAATPKVAVRAVTTPAFEVTDTSDVTLELTAVMANTGTLRVYGLGFHFNYNFN